MQTSPCHIYSKEITKDLSYSENVLHPRLSINEHILAAGGSIEDSSSINDLKATSKFEIRLNTDALEREAFIRTDLFFR